MSDTKTRSKPGSLGDVYDLLDAAFPGHRTRLGFLSVELLANDLEISNQALHGWFRRERIPAGKVPKLIELSTPEKSKKGEKPVPRLTIEKLTPYVFK